MAFDPVSVTGYNANPPEDDGTEAPTNEVTWAGIKTKLNDPVKTAFDALVTELTTTFDELFGVLMAAEGTDLLFAQATAPTGWTKQTTHNNKALRLVTGGTGGSAAGTTPFTDVLKARSIVQANFPSGALAGSAAVITDTRTFTVATRNNVVVQGGEGETVADDADGTLTMASPASGTIVGGSLDLGGSGTAMDFAVQYVDLIWCAKDAL